METKELARQLGISHQLCNRLKKRGMPTDSLQAAKDWRSLNLNLVQTKAWRIDGNGGVKRTAVKEESSDTDLIMRSFVEVLTNLVPRIWFGEIGWLGCALREQGVHVKAEQLIEAQGLLFLLYTNEVDKILEKENKYFIPDSLMVRPSDEAYPSLVERLNEILNKKASPRKR